MFFKQLIVRMLPISFLSRVPRNPLFQQCSTHAMVMQARSTSAASSLKILQYPAPQLRAPNQPVTSFDDDLRELSRNMFSMMYEDIGAGLAAPQVGVNKQLMVYNVRGDRRAWLSEVVLVNPRIVEASTTTAIDEEACLSFPDISGPVTRHVWVKVTESYFEQLVVL
jgi:peptide deformylase